MRLEEILRLHRWRCKHGHPGTVHCACALREGITAEKVGFIDIETSNLDANFGIMLTYCIKEEGKKKIWSGRITKKELRDGTLDRRIVAKCIKDMRRFDRLVGHYSSKFDIPFVRTRAIHWHIDDTFPEYGQIMHTDVWRLAKNLLKLNSNRQSTVAEAVIGHTGDGIECSMKTRIDPRHWIAALTGDKEALDYIYEHNVIDVIELEKNYEVLKKFSRKVNTSI